MNLRFLTLLLLLVLTARAEVRVPGATAYLDPDPNAARVGREGISRWRGPANTVSWFGQIKSTGKVEVTVMVKLPEGTSSKLRLSVGATSRDAEARGAGDKPVSVSFGTFDIPRPGYLRFELRSLNAAEAANGDVLELVLDGEATREAHFNLLPRRNAASVHLAYPSPEKEKIELFYCEATAVTEPLWTFYMACGFHRGYFGMQVNSPTERRIIFSVWDSGNEAVRRDRVADADRVKLMGKGEGVVAGDFGNEGTGGHSHLKYMWKTGEKQRFIVTAKPADATHTVFSGYYFHPDKQEWMLISSWNAPKDGGTLRGLHSFSENFGGSNGHVLRKALYGNQWVRTAEGKWIELTTASFSHDGTGKSDRLDRFMGVEKGEFFLSHGGFVEGFTKYGEKFTRPAGKKPDVELPEVGAK